MDTTFRDWLRERAAAEIDELEAAPRPVEPERLEQLRMLRRHLEEAIPSPLVYGTAADHYREWKG